MKIIMSGFTREIFQPIMNQEHLKIRVQFIKRHFTPHFPKFVEEDSFLSKLAHSHFVEFLVLEKRRHLSSITDELIWPIMSLVIDKKNVFIDKKKCIHVIPKNQLSGNKWL